MGLKEQVLAVIDHNVFDPDLAARLKFEIQNVFRADAKETREAEIEESGEGSVPR